MLKIMILDGIPSPNKGEAAIMHGIMTTVRTCCADSPISFFLPSQTVDEDRREYGDSVTIVELATLVGADMGFPVRASCIGKLVAKAFLFTLGRMMIGRWCMEFFRHPFWRAFSESDVVILGHDSAFRNSLHLPLILFSLCLKKKICVYGCTIGPGALDHAIYRFLGRKLLSKVQLITTREPRTLDYLREIGVTAPLFCTADKAFLLRAASEDRKKQLLDDLGLRKRSGPIIGVMVARQTTVYEKTFAGTQLSGAEKYQEHAQAIASALDDVIEQTGGTVIFLGHCVGPTRALDDRLVARDVAALMATADRVRLITEDLLAADLKAVLGACDLVVTERTHGGVAAATMWVPTLWLTHPTDCRTHGIVADTLGLDGCIYNVEKLDKSTLRDAILRIHAEREVITTKLKEMVPRAQDLAMKNAEYFKQYVIPNG